MKTIPSSVTMPPATAERLRPEQVRTVDLGQRDARPERDAIVTSLVVVGLPPRKHGLHRLRRNGLRAPADARELPQLGELLLELADPVFEGVEPSVQLGRHLSRTVRGQPAPPDRAKPPQSSGKTLTRAASITPRTRRQHGLRTGYSTVTVFARLRGWSTGRPRRRAMR
jgi:hypothetical protein